MEMPKILNPVDFIKIGIMGMVFIALVNKGLSHFGLEKYKA